MLEDESSDTEESDSSEGDESVSDDSSSSSGSSSSSELSNPLDDDEEQKERSPSPNCRSPPARVILAELPKAAFHIVDIKRTEQDQRSS